jgi:ribonuclease HI
MRSILIAVCCFSPLQLFSPKAGVEIVKKLGASNGQTRTDSEYVLARVRFEYKARGAPGDKPWELSGVQISAFSENNKPYASPAIVASQSGLKPSLRSGDTL